MSNILFEDEYNDQEVEFETPTNLKGFLTFAAVIAFLGAVFLAFMEAFVFSFVLLFEVIVCVLVIKWRSNVTLRQFAGSYRRKYGNTYLRVYEDRIVVKKLWKKEKVYLVSLNEYTVTLNHGGGRAWARLIYVFADKHGKKILRYASDRWATNYKVLKAQMKYDIRNVGCRNVFDMVGIYK